MDMNLSKLWEIAENREAWYAAVHGISKSWTQLSDWTPPLFNRLKENNTQPWILYPTKVSFKNMAKFRHFRLKTSQHWPAVFTNKNSKWYTIGRKELIPDKSSQLQEAIKSRKVVYIVRTGSKHSWYWTRTIYS